MAMHKYLDNIEEVVSVGECFRLYVRGFSMLPLLGYGRDNIIIRRTTEQEDILGRIAMFRTHSGHIIVHRVIKVENSIVTLQGDGNPYKQERCHRNDIVGVVESVIREDGREVSCSTRAWHMRERMWLILPAIVRRYALGIMRRMHRWRDNNQ